MPYVVVREEQAPSTGRKPREWRRWIEIRILARDCVFGFRADARSLTLDACPPKGARAEILAPTFEPLCAERTVRMHGADHTTREPAPKEVVEVAVEACRAAALRLYQHGVDRAAVTRPWPRGRAAFAGIVTGNAKWEALGDALPHVPYRRRRGRPRRKTDTAPFP